MKQLAIATEKAMFEILETTNGNKPSMELLKEISAKYNVKVDKLINIGNWENYDYNRKID